MEIIFKTTWPAAGESAPDAEIYIRPAQPGDAGRRDLAAYVVSRGVKALLQGNGPLTHIVVACDTTRPTFDDMLAATFAKHLLEGGKLGNSALKFAKYAALVREGLQPGNMALENSLEGVFLAIRNNASGDLTQSSIADKFLDDWNRMAHLILHAIDASKDPFVTELLSDSTEFAREQAFLKKDQAVYREDVNRGQQWQVSIPGGPPKSSMLVLELPRSLLWKYWSRHDTTAPIGGSYLFQVVRWSAGHWVMSTDPVQRLPIKELAETLQVAELAQNPAAANDPWFDGAPFGYTLVAAPRGGSKLSDDAILSIIKKWASAKPLVNLTHHVARKLATISGGTALAVITSVIITVVTQRLNHPATPPTPPPSQSSVTTSASSQDKQVNFTARGSMMDTAEVADLRSQGIHVPGFAVIVGVGYPQGDFPALPASCRNARLFYKVLRDYYGYDSRNMRLLVDQPKNPADADEPDIPADGPPTREGVQRAINDIGQMTGRYVQGDRTNFVFFYGGHGDPRQAPGNNKIGYLVLSGYQRNNADDTGFDMGYLVNFVSHRIASTHQLLLVDCCYSGFVIQARGLDNEKNKSAIYEMWGEKARAVITAGTADQQSLEVGPKALFTSNLVQALTPTSTGYLPADENHDGVVTDEELADYLQHKVASDAAQFNHRLTPQYLRALPDSDDDVGQFLFIPRNFGK